MYDKLIQGVVLAGLMVLPLSGQAETSWVFEGENNCVPNGCDDNYNGAADWSRTYNESGGSSSPVTVYGVYNSSNPGDMDPRDANNNPIQTSNGDLWLGPIDAWSGLGVHTYGEGWGSPNHSTDNSGSFESVLFDFGAGNMVDLNSVSIGWKSGDADISVLAYEPQLGDPTVADIVNNAANHGNSYTNLGSSYADLLGSGWSHIGDYSNLSVGTAKSVNSGDKKSRFWLVGAVNPQFGGNGAGWSTGNDFFKLKIVAGDVGGITTTSVPAPPALLMLGLGLVMMRGRSMLPSR